MQLSVFILIIKEKQVQKTFKVLTQSLNYCQLKHKITES